MEKESRTQTKVRPHGFYIKHLPGERPSKFYIIEVPEQVLFSLRAKKKKDEKQAA
jgi:hypothetical protein